MSYSGKNHSELVIEMEYIEALEYPRPLAVLDIEKIVIDIPDGLDGFFVLKNAGAGGLEGIVSSNSELVKISPEKFKGNHVKIIYSLNMEISALNETRFAEILISSNGGELIIPVYIQPSEFTVFAENGEKMRSLKGFSEYSKKYPVQAKALFDSDKFLQWLHKMEYDKIRLYEHFRTDENKARALDNFLVSGKLKKQASAAYTSKKTEIAVKKMDSGPISGKISVKMSGWGFLEHELIYDKKQAWFKPGNEKITSSDFDEGGNLTLEFKIFPGNLKQRFSNIDITLGKDVHTVSVAIKPLIRARLSKESFGLDDSGKIIIDNETGTDLEVEIRPRDAYVKLEGKFYIISAHAEIPFYFKQSQIQLAKTLFTRQLVETSFINIRTTYARTIYKFRLNYNMGELNIVSETGE